MTDYSQVNADIPEDFDPIVAFAAVANILAALRTSYGLDRLDIGSTGKLYPRAFIAVIWYKGGGGCSHGYGDNASEALQEAITDMRVELKELRS